MRPAKVLTTTDFVMWLNAMDDQLQLSDANQWDIVFDYAELMAKPLELGMFVPCVDGEIIKEKWVEQGDGTKRQVKDSYYDKYQRAKERVLFEGWKEGMYEVHDGKPKYLDVSPYDGAGASIWFNKYGTIEAVVNSNIIDLKPTEAFWKKIGL